MFDAEQLSRYNGDHASAMYLSILGEVYDVSRAPKFYGGLLGPWTLDPCTPGTWNLDPAPLDPGPCAPGTWNLDPMFHSQKATHSPHHMPRHSDPCSTSHPLHCTAPQCTAPHDIMPRHSDPCPCSTHCATPQCTAPHHLLRHSAPCPCSTCPHCATPQCTAPHDLPRHSAPCPCSTLLFTAPHFNAPHTIPHLNTPTHNASHSNATHLITPLRTSSQCHTTCTPHPLTPLPPLCLPAGKGSGYDFFVGRDASRAFVTGGLLAGLLVTAGTLPFSNECGCVSSSQRTPV